MRVDTFTPALAVSVALSMALAAACGSSSRDHGAPAVASQVLTAFKAKDAAALAPLVLAKHRAEFTESIAKMFDADKPNIAAMRAWDGATPTVRYAGKEALADIGPADGRRAVLELRKADDGQWYWAGIRYSSAADFAAWGTDDPGAAPPACNGGGKRVDKRPLPAPWAERGGAPEGAVACAFSDAPEASRYAFELGDGPEPADAAWRAHLQQHGWTIADDGDPDGLAFRATSGAVSLRVFTSKHVEDLGWTTVTIDPRR